MVKEGVEKLSHTNYVKNNLTKKSPHNTDFHTWMGKKHFCFFQTAETGNRTPNSGVKGSGDKHYPRAPALGIFKGITEITRPTKPIPGKTRR